MRLICPNCDAHYEVPDDVIPPEGRDVQCSNCGNTWFQPPADRAEEDDPDHALLSAQPDPQPEPEPEPEEEPEADPETREAPDLGPAPASPKPRQLDPEVANVLREEARHEARVRQAERGAVESQPDLGLDDMGRSDALPSPARAPSGDRPAGEGTDTAPTDREAELRARQARERMARLRGEDPDAPRVAAATAAASGSRRELLPDIEEINSTLRSTDQPRRSQASEEISAAPERAQRSSFRRGFFYVLLLIAIAALIYVYAGSISAKVPALSGALEAYVGAVNDLRGWLDARILAGLQWLDGMAAETAPPAE